MVMNSEDSSNNLNLVEEFISMTDSNEDVAQKWLEIGGYILSNAVELYLNCNQLSEEATLKSTAGNSNDDERNTKYPILIDDNIIRRPDPIRRIHLLPENNVIESSREKRRKEQIVTTFHSGKEISNMNSKEKTLSRLFQAPTDIICPLDFDEVTTVAKNDDKWLLVNIQKDSEFASHLINRDVWSDDYIRDMVKCTFIFWQQLDISSQGQLFIDRYKIYSYPHISIIDPKTGAMVWSRHIAIEFDKSKLIEAVQDFISEHATPSANTRPGIKKQSSNTSSHPIHSVIQLDKEDEKEKEDKEKKIITLDGLPDSPPREHKKIKLEPTTAEMRPKTGFSIQEIAALQSFMPPLDTTEHTIIGGNEIKIQFKFPNGKKVPQSFPVHVTMVMILTFVTQELTTGGKEGRFDIYYDYPMKSLKDTMIQWIKKDGLYYQDSQEKVARMKLNELIGSHTNVLLTVKWQ